MRPFSGGQIWRRSLEHASVRRRINRRITQLAIYLAAVVVLSSALVQATFIYRESMRKAQTNTRALREIRCFASACDVTEYLRDEASQGPDYVLDEESRYIINAPNLTIEELSRYPPLDYVDTSFVARFREPASYPTPDGEIWRLFSKQVVRGARIFEIVVGHQQKASSKMFDTPSSLIGAVDGRLEENAREIADSLPADPLQICPGSFRSVRSSGPVDGLLIIDGASKRVCEWESWLPAFLPKEISMPSSGVRIYRDGSDVYLLRTDAGGRVLTSSVVSIGSLWWLVGCYTAAFLLGLLITRIIAARYFRSSLALREVKVPSLEEALVAGEGQLVEFKRGLSPDDDRSGASEEEILKSIAAFANTNDGVIFVGIDDRGRVKGLDLDFKRRDLLEQKIRRLVKNRIRPTPPVAITFEDVRGLIVATIRVAKGEELVYLMNGVIYVRSGSSDCQAALEDLKRVLLGYAT